MDRIHFTSDEIKMEKSAHPLYAKEFMWAFNDRTIASHAFVYCISKKKKILNLDQIDDEHDTKKINSKFKLAESIFLSWIEKLFYVVNQVNTHVFDYLTRIIVSILFRKLMFVVSCTWTILRTMEKWGKSKPSFEKSCTSRTESHFNAFAIEHANKRKYA